MDADRFDTLTRTMGTPSSRRAALGATLAGGLLSALGLARTVPEASAAQGGTCTLAFAANVRLGPSQGQPLSAEGQAGAVQGNLSFGLDQSGRLINGELQAASGERFPVVGQATGYSLQARIELAPRVALVVVGVGEDEVAACRGAIDGVMSGPQVGDLGDWHAAATGGGGGRQGGGQNGDNTGRGGRSDRGGGGGRNNNQGSDAAAGGAVTGGNSGGTRGNNRGGGQANQGGGGRANQGGSGDSGGNGNGSGGGGRGQAATQQGACEADEVFCEDAGGGGFCAHLATNISNCGACGNGCDDSREFCQGGICVSKESVAAAACPPNEVFCFLEDGYCADLATDFLNCGLCGYVCATDEDCRDSVCVPRGGETGAQCADGLTDCNGTCVDTTSDPDNCGACGTLCPVSPEVFNCEVGVCVPPSCDPLVNCGGLCVDVLTDPLHCGGCGLACPAGEECRGSLCVPVGGGGGCKTGLTPCGPTCANLQTDANNCGGCGAACPAGEACVGGECVLGAAAGCPEGQIMCGDSCRTGLTLADGGVVCSGGGAPPTVCPPGQSLCNGACFATGACQPSDCPPGQGRCYGFCKDFATDPGNCGVCGNACPGAICSGGACADCAAGLTPCDTACVDTATDLNNCGFCGNLCGTQCIDGQCSVVGPAPTVTCSAGTTRCGDACVDTTSDNANCGQCGNVCNEASVCSGGSCVNSDAACAKIAVYLSACGTRCVDTRTDPEHCGGCRTSCGAGSECHGGMCTVPAAAASAATLAGEEPPAFSCPEGQDDCGGGCTDLSFDPLNCGFCGNFCPSGLCESGTCIEAVEEAPAQAGCLEGQADCGGGCIDILSDPANCGFCGTVCPSGQCAGGACVEVVEQAPEQGLCPDGQADCGGGCLDVLSDPANCGFCGNLCAVDQQCVFGVCSA